MDAAIRHAAPKAAGSLRSVTDDDITLTPFVLADAAVMCEGDNDPELRRWFDFPPEFVASLAHSEDVVRRWDAERRSGTRFPFAVRSVMTNEVLGGCELRPAAPHVANLSYWTYPPHRGRGVAVRAVRLARDVAFHDFGIHTIEVVIDPANVISQRVAYAAGFVQNGIRDGKLLFLCRLE